MGGFMEICHIIYIYIPVETSEMNFTSRNINQLRNPGTQRIRSGMCQDDKPVSVQCPKSS